MGRAFVARDRDHERNEHQAASSIGKSLYYQKLTEAAAKRQLPEIFRKALQIAKCKLQKEK